MKHFSDTVEYSSNGFLEKNRDTISKELVGVLTNSDLDICNFLMSMDPKAETDDLKTSLDGRVVISAAKQLVTNELPFTSAIPFHPIRFYFSQKLKGEKMLVLLRSVFIACKKRH